MPSVTVSTAFKNFGSCFMPGQNPGGVTDDDDVARVDDNRTADIQKPTPSEQRTAFCTTPLRYLKVIRSVRLRVEALSFKGSFAAFSLC